MRIYTLITQKHIGQLNMIILHLLNKQEFVLLTTKYTIFLFFLIYH